MRIAGVDPGAHGALALLVDGNLLRVDDMPKLLLLRGKSEKAEVDGYTLADLLREYRPDVLVVEQVGGFTGQSPSAAFNFGRAAGAPEYAAKALKIRVEHVPPGTWKRAMGLRDAKDESRALAMRLWPGLAAQFKRKMDNDRAEAALIAEWWRRKNCPAPQKEQENVFG